MRCANCGAWSLRIICPTCLKILAQTNTGIREIEGFKIYYFYKYSEISKLISSKHHVYGHKIFSLLADLTFKKFSQNYKFGQKIAVLPLDDNVRSGFSHTAILAHALKSKELTPVYKALRAKSKVKYSGKSLNFRKKNPRKFELLKDFNEPIILVDDLVTTGLSMLEAKKLLNKANKDVLFGLVLADARD